MTPFRFIQLAFVASMVLLLAACFFWGWQLEVLLIPIGIFLALFSYGSFFVNSGFHLKAICKGDRSKKQIAITFDDGPHPEFTPAILAVLNEHNVKATFFCIGERMERHLGLVKQMMAEGHIIGNHSYEHGWGFSFKSAHGMQVELNKTSHLLEQNFGYKTRYIRPPYGVTNPNLAKAIKATNMVAIGWSLRSMDTASKNPKWVLKKVTSGLKGGDIVLFHDKQAVTVLVLKEFLEFCTKEGYQVVPLPELINIPAYD